MSDNFEWKTEEDIVWEKEVATPRKPPSPRRRSYAYLLLLSVVLLVLFFVMRRQVNQQLESVEDNVQTDILATHNLIQRAAGGQDSDLLLPLISGRDADWVAAQEALVANDWFNQPRLLEEWEVSPAPILTTGEVSMTLALDLRTAELAAPYTYTLLGAMGEPETVTLERTAVYRRGRTRWLMTPPEAVYWGNWVTSRRTYISLVYPNRDKAFVTRLGGDLNELVSTICSELAGITCPVDFQVQVRLEKDPAILLAALNSEEKFQTGLNLTLPTPSLLGLPVDEVGYQAVYRVYAEQIATAVITDLTGYDCCRWVMLYQGMLDKQLHELGLKPWMLSQEMYDTIFEQDMTGRIAGLLDDQLFDSPEAQWRIYAFVEFLEQDVVPGVPLATMQHALSDSRTFKIWLNHYADQTIDINFIDTAFLQFIYRHTKTGQADVPPLPLPSSGEVQLICDGDTDFMAIYRLNLETETWTDDFSYEYLPSRWAYVRPLLSQPGRYLITERQLQGNGGTQFIIIQDDEVLAEFSLNDTAFSTDDYYYSDSDPNGRYLIMTRVSTQSTEVSTEMGLLDVEACLQGDCQLIEIEGWLTWAPDSKRSLYALQMPWEWQEDLDNWDMLYRADSRGRILKTLGPGAHPFWLDSKTYAYLMPNGEDEVTLITAVSGIDQPRPLVSASDLLAALPDIHEVNDLRFTRVFALPSEVPVIMMQMRDASRGSRHSYYFRVVLSPNLTEVESIDMIYMNDFEHGMGYSPNGRWLVMYDYVHQRNGIQISLIDVQTGEIRLIDESAHGYGPSWSSDGNWYLLNQQDHMLISAPEYAYHKLIFHNFKECGQAFWVEK